MAEGVKTLVGGLIGAVAGYFIAGPQGAAIGFSVGAGLGAGFEEKTPIEVGRVTDLTTTGASYGDPIPRVYGTMPVPSVMLFNSGLLEDKNKKKEGGGLFSSGTEVTTYKYSLDVAYCLCEGPIEGVGRIWLNGILIYDGRSTAEALSFTAKSKFYDRLTIYKGTETQTPDSMIESYEGAGNVSAYRGLAYLVLEGLRLKRFYNKAPNQVKVEIIKDNSADAPPSILQTLTTERVTSDSGVLDNGTVLIGRTSTDGLDSDYEFDHILYRTDLYGEILEQTTYPVRLPNTLSNSTAYEIQNEPRAVFWRNIFGGSTSRLFWDGTQIGIENFVGSTGPLGCVDYRMYGEDEHRTAKLLGGKYYVTTTYGADGPGLVRYFADEFGRPTFDWDLARTFNDLLSRTGVIGTNFWLYPDAENDDRFFVFWTATPNNADTGYLVYYDIEFNVLAQWAKNDGPPISNQISRNFLIGPGYCLIRVSNTSSLARLYSFDETVSGSTWSVDGSVTIDNSVTYNGLIPLTDSLVMSRFEILTRDELVLAGGQTLQAVVEDILGDYGYQASELDMSGLSGTVEGYRIPGPKTGRGALEDLQLTFYFDIVEIDYKLVGVMRGGSSVVTIPAGDMAAHDGDAEVPDMVPRERAEELELPRQITIKYLDRETNYEVGAEGSSRQVTDANDERVVTVNVTLDKDKAIQAAHVLLYREHQQRETLTIRLTEQYQYLTPTDIVTIDDNGDAREILLLEESENPNGFIEFQAVPEFTPIYTQTMTGSGSSADYADIVDQNGPALLVWLDIPIMDRTDDNLGVYAAAAGYLSSWSGHDLFKYSAESSQYNRITRFVDQADAGRAEDALGDHTTGAIDWTNSVTVRLAGPGSLASSTEAAVIQDRNINRAVLGREGRYEVLQFITATALGDGRYTLTGLLRGRRGTNYAIGNHASGDLFAVLAPATAIRLFYASTDIGETITHKFAGSDESIDDVSTIGLEFDGVALLPFAPAAIAAAQSGADWVIDWTPRSRLAGALVPNQASETDPEIASYTVDFLDGSDVVKGTYTVTVGTETRTYTSAEQTADFGSAQSDIVVVVYQKGTTLDREGHGIKLDTATGAISIVDPKI